jgi:hypothetical protein
MAVVNPREPEVDRTGRLITEWFEKPAPEAAPERSFTRPEGFGTMTGELVQQWIAQGRKPGGLGNTKFHGSMSRQEVQVRLDEASKMVSVENVKFLPPDIQARTGLELNPLWMMECLVRSGSLNPNQMVNALRTLTEYTHSKAPSMSQNISLTGKAEDFLLKLAEEEYPQVEVEPKKKRKAPGTGPRAEFEKARREKWKAEGRVNERGKYVPLRDLGGTIEGDPPEVEG